MEKVLELLSKSLNCVYELIDNISRDNNFMILDQQQKLLGLIKEINEINASEEFNNELDFNNFINSFAKQWNSLVEAKALEIIKEKYQRIEEATMEIIEELENKRDYVLGYTRD